MLRTGEIEGSYAQITQFFLLEVVMAIIFDRDPGLKKTVDEKMLILSQAEAHDIALRRSVGRFSGLNRQRERALAIEGYLRAERHISDGYMRSYGLSAWRLKSLLEYLLVTQALVSPEEPLFLITSHRDIVVTKQFVTRKEWRKLCELFKEYSLVDGSVWFISISNSPRRKMDQEGMRLPPTLFVRQPMEVTAFRDAWNNMLSEQN